MCKMIEGQSVHHLSGLACSRLTTVRPLWRSIKNWCDLQCLWRQICLSCGICIMLFEAAPAFLGPTQSAPQVTRCVRLQCVTNKGRFTPAPSVRALVTLR